MLALQRRRRASRENDTRGNFQSAAFRQAFTFYVDLFRKGSRRSPRQTQVANL